MALIKCPECGKEISDHAKSCPNCGFPIKEKPHKNLAKIIIILTTLIVLAVLIVVVIGKSKNKHDTQASLQSMQDNAATTGDTIIELEANDSAQAANIEDVIVGTWEGSGTTWDNSSTKGCRITFSDNGFVYEKKFGSKYELASKGTYIIDDDLIKCETPTGKGTDYHDNRPPIFKITNDNDAFVLVGGGMRLSKNETTVDTEDIIKNSNKKYCSVEGCENDPVKELWLGASGREDEYYCAEHRAIGEERWEKLHDDSFNACYVPGCLNYGTHTITGLNGTDEYYCDKHYKQMADTLGSMLGNKSTNTTSVKSETVSGDERTLYWTIAKEEVKLHLKSPSTAKFPFSSISDGVDITKADDIVTVKSYVDAQNSFGAEVRTYFTVKIKLNGTKYSIESCIID